MSTDTLDTSVKEYAVDPGHSQVNFAVTHMGFSKVRGGFESFSGHITVDPDNIETLETEAAINISSISTGEDDRDEHLRSDDFFNAEEYPDIKFQSKEVKDISGESFTLVGDLTIRGTTKEVELDATFLGQAKDPWGNQRVGFEAETTIQREDYGLTWNQVLETGGVLVGKSVHITLEVQAAHSSDE